VTSHSSPLGTKEAHVEVRRARLILSALAVVLALAAPRGALAKNPEDVFRGQVLTSKKRLPTSDASVSKYIAKLKASRTDRFQEDKATQSWKIHYAAFFRRPLNDLEVTVRLFEISGGGKKLINSFEQYVDTRGAKSLISSFTLERKYAGVNKQVQIVLENKGAILATGKFWILGEGEKFTGKADFSEEEAKQGVKETDE
jgi:hypothetical protein